MTNKVHDNCFKFQFRELLDVGKMLATCSYQIYLALDALDVNTSMSVHIVYEATE